MAPLSVSLANDNEHVTRLIIPNISMTNENDARMWVGVPNERCTLAEGSKPMKLT